MLACGAPLPAYMSENAGHHFNVLLRSWSIHPDSIWQLPADGQQVELGDSQEPVLACHFLKPSAASGPPGCASRLSEGG